MYKIPESWPCFWPGDLPDGKSSVLAVFTYPGVYPEYFTHVLRVRAIRTNRGWLEIAVKLPTLHT